MLTSTQLRTGFTVFDLLARDDSGRHCDSVIPEAHPVEALEFRLPIGPSTHPHEKTCMVRVRMQVLTHGGVDELRILLTQDILIELVDVGVLLPVVYVRGEVVDVCGEREVVGRTPWSELAHIDVKDAVLATYEIGQGVQTRLEGRVVEGDLAVLDQEVAVLSHVGFADESVHRVVDLFVVVLFVLERGEVADDGRVDGRVDVQSGLVDVPTTVAPNGLEIPPMLAVVHVSGAHWKVGVEVLECGRQFHATLDGSRHHGGGLSISTRQRVRSHVLWCRFENLFALRMVCNVVQRYRVLGVVVRLHCVLVAWAVVRTTPPLQHPAIDTPLDFDWTGAGDATVAL